MDVDTDVAFGRKYCMVRSTRNLVPSVWSKVLVKHGQVLEENLVKDTKVYHQGLTLQSTQTESLVLANPRYTDLNVVNVDLVAYWWDKVWTRYQVKQTWSEAKVRHWSTYQILIVLGVLPEFDVPTRLLIINIIEVFSTVNILLESSVVRNCVSGSYRSAGTTVAKYLSLCVQLWWNTCTHWEHQ